VVIKTNFCPKVYRDGDNISHHSSSISVIQELINLQDFKIILIQLRINEIIVIEHYSVECDSDRNIE